MLGKLSADSVSWALAVADDDVDSPSPSPGSTTLYFFFPSHGNFPVNWLGKMGAIGADEALSFNSTRYKLDEHYA